MLFSTTLAQELFLLLLIKLTQGNTKPPKSSIIFQSTNFSKNEKIKISSPPDRPTKNFDPEQFLFDNTAENTSLFDIKCNELKTFNDQKD